MLDICIIAIGVVKERYWEAAMEEYKKRLAPYARLHCVVLAEEKIFRAADRQRVIEREGKKIIAAIPPDSWVVALDAGGRQYDSVALADKLVEWSRFGTKLVFIVGGPLGLAPGVLQLAQVRLSLSLMTFTHQMTQVILLEQLYRAVTIQQDMAYHY